MEPHVDENLLEAIEKLGGKDLVSCYFNPRFMLCISQFKSFRSEKFADY